MRTIGGELIAEFPESRLGLKDAQAEFQNIRRKNAGDEGGNSPAAVSFIRNKISPNAGGSMVLGFFEIGDLKFIPKCFKPIEA